MCCRCMRDMLERSHSVYVSREGTAGLSLTQCGRRMSRRSASSTIVLPIVSVAVGGRFYVIQLIIVDIF